MQLSDKADALVAPKPVVDTLGPCKRHPEATEIAFYVISTAMVCFLLSASFPLVLSCIGAANRMWAKKAARQMPAMPAETEEKEETEMRPWARSRKYGVAAAAAAAEKEDKKECVVNVLENEDQDIIKETKAPQTDEIEVAEKTDTKEDDGVKKDGEV